MRLFSYEIILSQRSDWHPKVSFSTSCWISSRQGGGVPRIFFLSFFFFWTHVVSECIVLITSWLLPLVSFTISSDKLNKKKKKKIHFPFHLCSNVKHPPSRHLRKDKIRILIFNKRFRPLTEMEEEEQEEEGEMPGTCWTFPPCGIIKMFYFSFFLGFLIEKNSRPASWLGHDPQSTAAAAAATAVLMLRGQSLVEAPWPAP